ncbi:MAG: NifU family protein [Solirubrobacterales bacterium]|nr:NifU family protein [Solirubrobacterales bacterium]
MQAHATAAPVSAPTPEQLFERVQQLQDQLELLPEGPSRSLAEELLGAVVQMYGAGLERIIETLGGAGEPGEQLALELADDPFVATLLLIHDLHPLSLEQRVEQALDSVRPYMESHGGNVELLSLQEGLARIHLRGSCSDCSASSVTLELAVKQALEELAPDLEGLEVEGVAPQMPGLGLPMAGANGSGSELPVVMSGAPAPRWVELDSAASGLAPGALTTAAPGGVDVIVANVEGTLLAYRDVCAGCGSSLRDGVLSEGALRCSACERSFFLPRAGRSLDDEQLQLEPVPLLREGAAVKVALAA